MFADMPVRVTCGLCGHSQQLHAFRLIRMIGKKADAAKLPLWQPAEPGHARVLRACEGPFGGFVPRPTLARGINLCAARLYPSRELA